MKIATIVGARPQFIKAAPVSRAIHAYNHQKDRTCLHEIIVHTGQHYDENMSQVFFDELEIPEPVYNLGVGSGSHGKMTGTMLERIEEVLVKEEPDMVLVYGDTNSTLASALAATKLHVPVGHVEAGLRSFNRRMPEEINRVVTDHLSSLLLCPTGAAVRNLQAEGITQGVFRVGDVMLDSFIYNQRLSERKSKILAKLGLEPKSFCLATVHREENTTSVERLAGIFQAFEDLTTPDCVFVVPLHPRTAKVLSEMGNEYPFGFSVRFLAPISYLDMIQLEANAKVILTDSGGVQKEAYFAGVPCVTLRDETEWVELVEHGFNMLAGHEPESICRAFETMVERNVFLNQDLYGGGKASNEAVSMICGFLNI